MIKAIILMSILFSGFFIIGTPQSSGKIVESSLGFINLSTDVGINWTAQDIAEPIVPRGTPKALNVRVTYAISKGGYFGPGLSGLALQMYSGLRVPVRLDIADKSEWAQVSLSTYDVYFTITDGTLQEDNIVMTIQLDQDAPGYLQGFIDITATVDTLDKPLLPSIQGFTQTFTLNFVPEYLPLVDPQPAGSNRRSIGPMDTAEFPIQIENQGNERTTVFFSVKKVPSDWEAIITDSITLEVGEKATVHLSIRPPRGFGYHYDTETFIVSVEPHRATDLSLIGEERTVTVQVESRGFSIIGIEMIIIPLIIIIAIILFLYYYYFNPRKNL
jgi:hypothetical protein